MSALLGSQRQTPSATRRLSGGVIPVSASIEAVSMHRRELELDRLVAHLPNKERRLEAMRDLVGGVTATQLRGCRVDNPTFAALARGLRHANPRVRWWCVQLLDHLDDPRAL